MPEAGFCEGCPMRGTTDGEIKGSVRFEMDIPDEHYHGFVGAIVTENNGVSEPIKLPSADYEREVLYSEVDACPHPEMKQQGIFNKREVPVRCSILSGLAIKGVFRGAIIKGMVTGVVQHGDMGEIGSIPPAK